MSVSIVPMQHGGSALAAPRTGIVASSAKQQKLKSSHGELYDVALAEKQQKLKSGNGDFYGPALACEKVRADRVFAGRAVHAFEQLAMDGAREKVAFGGSSPSASSSFSALPSDKFRPRFSRGSVVQRRGRRRNGNVMKAIPVDAYWITAAQAVAVAGLMGGVAVVAGVLINIKIEIQALAEFKELEEKGMLPEEFDVPDKDFDMEAPLYIFQNKQFPPSSSPSRNRPVREEFEPEPQLKPELKTELEPATSKE